MDNNIDVAGSGVKFIDRGKLIGLAARVLGAEHKVLLICDMANSKCSEETQKYISALEKGDVLSAEDREKLSTPGLQLVVVPFKSLYIAEEVYRSIPHATHFVTLWVDGEPYAGAC